MNEKDIWERIEKYATFAPANCSGPDCWWISPDHMELLVASIKEEPAPASSSARDQEGVRDERELFEAFWTSNLLSFGPIGGREFTIAWVTWQNRAALAAQAKSADHIVDANKKVESAAPVEPAGWLRDQRGEYEGRATLDTLFVLGATCPTSRHCATYSPVYFATPPAAIPEAPKGPSFSLIRALVQEKNKLHAALELACGYLTDEQAHEIAQAMPDEAGIPEAPANLPDKWEAEAQRFAALDDPISLAEAACMRNLAKELRAASPVHVSEAPAQTEAMADKIERIMREWQGANKGVHAIHACALDIAQRIATPSQNDTNQQPSEGDAK